jgi:hypothetical protein
MPCDLLLLLDQRATPGGSYEVSPGGRSEPFAWCGRVDLRGAVARVPPRVGT